MTSGVLSGVEEQTKRRRRETCASNLALVEQSADVCCADLLEATIECGLRLGQQDIECGLLARLSSCSSQLRRRQLFAACIGQESFSAAADVPDVEPDRGCA